MPGSRKRKAGARPAQARPQVARPARPRAPGEPEPPDARPGRSCMRTDGRLTRNAGQMAGPKSGSKCGIPGVMAWIQEHRPFTAQPPRRPARCPGPARPDARSQVPARPARARNWPDAPAAARRRPAQARRCPIGPRPGPNCPANAAGAYWSRNKIIGSKTN